MLSATTEYIQAEQALRGAQPVLKLHIFPYDLDYGLASGSGEHLNTVCLGPKTLGMAPGYYTSGFWISPIVPAYSAHITRLEANWLDQAGYLDVTVSLRTTTEYNEFSNSPWSALPGGIETSLQAYFQLKVEFNMTIRAWAVDLVEDADAFTVNIVDTAPDDYLSYASDGLFPGQIQDLTLNGFIQIEADEIINPGIINQKQALDFSDITIGHTEIVLDNRNRQWLPGSSAFYLSASDWYSKRLRLYHGFQLPNQTYEWHLIFSGFLRSIGNSLDKWLAPHNVTLVAVDLINEALQKKIGSPAADGSRQPFIRGYYSLKAELTESLESYCSPITHTGTGTATLTIVNAEKYSGKTVETYIIEAETTGEIGAATLKWSKDNGSTWEKTGMPSTNITNPGRLEERLEFYWTGGAGNDFVTGDRWIFTAYPNENRYLLPGSPFESITTVYLNDAELFDYYTAHESTGQISLFGQTGLVYARIVKDGTNHPADILQDILSEIGLAAYLDTTLFQLAKLATLEYDIGVCFEDIIAIKAIQQICETCLYSFWVEAEAIKIKAYLGKA